MFILLVASFALAQAIAPDDGYEGMFSTQNQTVERTCQMVPNLPDFLDGSFLLPTVAQFEMGK